MAYFFSKRMNEQPPRKAPSPLLNLPPRGLSRTCAAAYIGVSPTKFDEMVKDKRIPRAIRIDGRRVWDRIKLDEAFAALPDEGEEGRTTSAWDEFNL
jgi:predicted DNA-binding transcriptional regulator AlpA